MIDLPPNQILQINATIIAGALIFLTIVSGIFNADRYTDSSGLILNIVLRVLGASELAESIDKAEDSAYWASLLSILIPTIAASTTIVWFSISSCYTLTGNESKGIHWMWLGFTILIGSGIVFLATAVIFLILATYNAIT